MKLILEDGTEFSPVDPQTITDALARVDGIDNNFIVLLDTEETFMQTAFQERGLYALEVRNTAGKQYESAVWATLAQVTAAFQKFAQRDTSYLRDFNWQEVVLT